MPETLTARGNSLLMKSWNTSDTLAVCNAFGFLHKTVCRYAKDLLTFVTTENSPA